MLSVSRYVEKFPAEEVESNVSGKRAHSLAVTAEIHPAHFGAIGSGKPDEDQPDLFAVGSRIAGDRQSIIGSLSLPCAFSHRLCDRPHPRPMVRPPLPRPRRAPCV